MQTIGILAYGSLIEDPGDEIKRATKSLKEDVKTPFPIEFARMSSSRNNAPTLIPVTAGGAEVTCVIYVLAEDITKKAAQDMLWRRETRSKPPKGYNPPQRPGKNTVIVEEQANFGGLDLVLYTNIRANIDRLIPENLAKLAISSVQADSRDTRRDGISYLISVKRAGIVTPLMPEYEENILRQTGAKTLEQALEICVDRYC